ncbi:MAG: acyl-CoA dehydrogenase family protein [Bacteroidetes bacterium]|nr:acyl-CoA dehydrogenase family protein [Bacteroidota bacterium]
MNFNATLKILPGAGWLISEPDINNIHFPENQDADNAVLQKKCKEFLRDHVMPFIDEIDDAGRTRMPPLLKRAGKESLLAISIPVKWGGLGKNFIDAGIATETLGAGNSFSVAYAAHTGIGLLPILYFGNEWQRQKYLPSLCSGEYLGAYALTEPNSGSDAMAASTTASLSDDQKYYLLNGQKCWITNGGFADIFTVFAKIKGDNEQQGQERLSAFIVEKNFEGFTQGPDEKKMGIKGSSTTALYFDNCKVPVSNLLGEAGKGHIIAFNILNIGRLKLAQFNLGAIKYSFQKMVDQLPVLVSNAGILEYYIVRTAVNIFTSEASIYRTASLIQNMQPIGDKDDQHILLKAAEEYAIECAMMKIYASELMNETVDAVYNIYAENVVPGISDVLRNLLDARINRIYEGTNEINRIFMMTTLAKRFNSGRLTWNNEVNFSSLNSEGLMAPEKNLIQKSKQLFIEIFELSLKTFGHQFSHQQEIITCLSNIFTQIFHMESAILRVIAFKKMQDKELFEHYAEMARYFLYQSIDSIYKNGKDCLLAFLTGEILQQQLEKWVALESSVDFSLHKSAKKIFSYLKINHS